MLEWHKQSLSFFPLFLSLASRLAIISSFARDKFIFVIPKGRRCMCCHLSRPPRSSPSSSWYMSVINLPHKPFKRRNFYSSLARSLQDRKAREASFYATTTPSASTLCNPLLRTEKESGWLHCICMGNQVKASPSLPPTSAVVVCIIIPSCSHVWPQQWASEHIFCMNLINFHI